MTETKPTSPVTSTRAGNERCPTCERTATEHRGYQPERCRDPWHRMIQADSIVSEKVCDHPSTEKAASSLVERLRSNEPLPICPFERMSPEYWTTPNDKPCKFCGGLPDGPDKCRGADTRLFAEAADEIERLRAAPPAASLIAHPANSHRSLPESSEPSLLGRTGGEIIGYCGWHPDRGYNFPTMAETVQGATSLMLRTGLASGNHRWEILPLYYAASPSLLGRETVREETIEECAKVAQGTAPVSKGNFFEARRKQTAIIVARIRALASLSPLKE